MCQITILTILWISVTRKMVLPAGHSRHVCCTVTKDMINEIFRTNAIRTVNAFEITKCFV